MTTKLAGRAVLVALLAGCVTVREPALDCRATAAECRAFVEDRERTAEALKPTQHQTRRQPYACALVGHELVCAIGVVGY